MIIIPTEKRFDWKHTPVVLFGIVLLNTLIFFFYQTSDFSKLETALNAYLEKGYLEHEWPEFEKYIESRKEYDLLKQSRSLYQSGLDEQLAATIVMRIDFYTFLDENDKLRDVANSEVGSKEERAKINEAIKSASYIKHGLTPSELKLHSLLTHQFLHGSIMHLLGNMFFLVICGFAVEAALGHARFLIFYVVGGVAGGLLHMMAESQSSTPLVGASGAISGVMAMYLGVFRLRRIEFFYWFFIFVGYIRVPALMILPFYIGKELYSYYGDTGSNVAFMAHAGGFIAGAVLLLVSYVIKPNIVNEEYIEEDQRLDPRQEKLEKIYGYMGAFQFPSAYKAIEEFIGKYGENFDLLFLKYKISSIENPERAKHEAQMLLSLDACEVNQLKKIEEVWKDNGESSQLDEEKRIQLGIRLSTLSDSGTAEKIFRDLYEKKCRHSAFPEFAKCLSLVYQQAGDNKKSAAYHKFSKALRLKLTGV